MAGSDSKKMGEGNKAGFKRSGRCGLKELFAGDYVHCSVLERVRGKSSVVNTTSLLVDLLNMCGGYETKATRKVRTNLRRPWNGILSATTFAFVATNNGLRRSI